MRDHFAGKLQFPRFECDSGGLYGFSGVEKRPAAGPREQIRENPAVLLEECNGPTSREVDVLRRPRPQAVGLLGAHCLLGIFLPLHILAPF